MISSERILLIGLGGVGRHLAERLSADGHHLTVVDQDPQRLALVEDRIDARLVAGDVLRKDTWASAEAADADVLIAVTQDDAVNALACRIGAKLGIAHRIARLRDLETRGIDALLSQEELSVHRVIRPTDLAVGEITRTLKRRSGNVRIDMAEDEVTVVATHVQLGSPLAHKRVRELGRAPGGFKYQVVCVARDLATLIPDGGFKIQRNDHVFLLASTGNIPSLNRWLNISGAHHHDVLIVGGGLTGLRLAEQLQHSFSVTLLERNPDRAAELAHRLHRTTVLVGDGSKAETLRQCGLLNMDTVVACTSDDETNLITSLMGKHLVHSHGDADHADRILTVSLTHKEEYLVLASAMGNDLAVNKKVLAANAIMRHLRRGHVLDIAHLHGCDAELVELVAAPQSPITQKPLMDFPDLRGHIFVGAVFQRGAWHIARGPTQIHAGERAICVALPSALRQLQQLFLA